MCIASGVADSSFQYNSYRTLSSSSGPAAGATAVPTADQMDLDALPATNSSPTSIKSWIRSSVKQSVQAKVARTGHCQELHGYLNSLPVDCGDTTPLDLVAWWGVSHVAIALALTDANSSFLQEHALRYPTLARVAHDYLPTQGSAVKYERAFSSSGRTITERRNPLHPQTVGYSSSNSQVSVCQRLPI